MEAYLKKNYCIILILIFCYSSVTTVYGQYKQDKQAENFSAYFQEIKEATKRGYNIWNRDLYGNILLVDVEKRKVYANTPDSAHILVISKGVYEGQLQDNINIANTSIHWGGKTWAMIMLPLPEDKYGKVNLSVHELFHTVQASLGFSQNNKESYHLEQKDGRIYLRLELEALKKAVLSKIPKDQKKYIKDALVFRKYRHAIFPGSDEIENQLELNEGIAEYTGFAMSGRNGEQARRHLVNSLETFIKNPTYVRSFAYITIPMYGYLAGLGNKKWNLEIFGKTDLTNFFVEKFKIALPADLKISAGKIVKAYDGTSIIEQEEIRDKKIKIKIAEYKAEFIEKPHFEIVFEKMNISFDPRNILAVEDKGTVYPNLRITDHWGILEVSKGALIAPDWSKVSLSALVKTDGQTIEGDGWILKLNDNYHIDKNEKNGNYILVKKVY